jgi:hypothetical protein
MTKSGILAAAAILASALAGPAMAQEVVYNPGYCAQFYPNANCQNRGPGSPYTGSYQRQAYQDQAYRDRTWQDSYNSFDDDRGFWPGDVAAGVVGGAVGTAAAIATAPIGGDEYARRNGFVCFPAAGSAARTAGGISANSARANRIRKRRLERPPFPCGSDESGS